MAGFVLAALLTGAAPVALAPAAMAQTASAPAVGTGFVPAPTRPGAAALAPWPGADYDPAIPTIAQVLGFEPGLEIATHADARRYFEALAAAAPDRVRIVEMGRSWRGRGLYHVVVAAPGTIARLDGVKADMQRLADPRRTDRDAASSLIDGGLPAPVWLTYAVHGNEVSGTDTAMLTAYHLLAARGDPRVPGILENTVVLINPLQNPDGRERFIHSHREARGLHADGAPLSAERDEPWPRGRANHYLFDLNRDWFAQTQPETRAQAAALLEWFPVVLADVHEMGTDESYFFPPTAEPTNPWTTPRQRENRELIGRNNARWFDTIGEDYFTRETFDLFYPGYGDGWPTYHGTIAMTYEQGSARGLLARRSDGRILTFADTIRNQFTAGLATLEAVSLNRARFLTDLYEFRADAVAEGEAAEDRFLILPAGPAGDGAARLAGLLAAQGVEVMRATAPFAACRTRYAAGTHLIDTAQPAKRLIRVLLEPEVALDKAFAEEQEKRRARGLPDEIYDVTAWSLPLLYNVPLERCRAAEAPGERVKPFQPAQGGVTDPGAAVGYLVPWGDGAAVRFLTAALEAGLKVKSADQGFTQGGRAWPGGTLIIERAANGPDLTETVTALAARTGAMLTGIADSWVTDGPSFGSDKVVRLTAPRIALAWDEPTDVNAAGAARFVIERQMGWPVTVIRTDRLARGDLSEFDVLVLPGSGRGYDKALGDGSALRDWVKRGGVLVGLGTATRWLADPDTNLLSIRRELAADLPADGEDGAGGSGGGGSSGGGSGGGGSGGAGGEGGDSAESPTVPGILLTAESDWKDAIQPAEKDPDSVAGVLLRARVDQDHWLTAGMGQTVPVMVQGPDIYTPVTLDEGVNVIRLPDADSLRASGYLWEENRRQLAFKPVAVVEEEGRGLVIAFPADPTFRGFMDGMTPALASALFRAPARTR